MILRVKVDSDPVMYIDSQGEVHWLDLDKLRSFCERFFGGTVLESAQRGPVTEVVSTSAIDLDLLSVGAPTALGSRSSVRLAFGVEDRIASQDS
jgi:hypothetical protein